MSQHDNKQKLFGNFSWFPAFSQEHLPPHKCGMEKASNYGSFSRFHRTSTHLKIAWTIWTCLTSSTLHRRISYICLTLKAELKTPPGSPTPSVGFQFIRFFFFCYRRYVRKLTTPNKQRPQQVEAKRLCSSLCKLNFLFKQTYNSKRHANRSKVGHVFNISFCLCLS